MKGIYSDRLVFLIRVCKIGHVSPKYKYLFFQHKSIMGYKTGILFSREAEAFERENMWKNVKQCQT